MSSQSKTAKPRKPWSFATLLVRAFESIGILNKGSAGAPATPSPEQAATTTGISTNALNVTRVGGLAALIAAVGAASMTIFDVDKINDDPAVVVAAYISVGIIIASALLAAAIIINADIRSRVAAGTATMRAATSATEVASFIATWQKALKLLNGALKRLKQHNEGIVDAWLDGSASCGLTAQLDPVKDQQAMHARLQAGQSLILAKLKSLIGETDAGEHQKTVTEIEMILNSMERSLQH